jgi:putative cardiolipin synthase
LLLQDILRAADRGVHVRMLLDDIGTAASDDALLALESHPNIEVRLFNPVATRSARMLGVLFNYRTANRRMHNKTFIADNQVAIVGGRNIGDEYFAAHGEMNFADLDVVTIGPVVSDVSREFDVYWNSPSSSNIATLAHQRESPAQLEARLRAFQAKQAANGEFSAMEVKHRSSIASQIEDGSLSFLPGRAWALYDDPAKITSAPEDRTTHLGPKLRSIANETQRTLFIVSPYFIPGKEGVDWLGSLRERGVRVVVLTNSLASTDVAVVHAAYKKYRKALLSSGIEIYELKPQPGAKAKMGNLLGSSRAGLHAKSFTFDERTIFIGSMNLDPRSIHLNTEVGTLIECPALASELTGKVLRNLDGNTYEVRLAGRKLEWVTTEGGRSVRFTAEPETSAWQRFKTALLGCLPIESQL